MIDATPSLEAVADAVVGYDPRNGEILTVNEAYADLVGRSRRDLPGTDVRRLVVGAEEGPVRACEGMERGESVRREWDLRTADGGTVPVEAALSLATQGGQEVAVASLRERRDGRPTTQTVFEKTPVPLWEFDLAAVREYALSLSAGTDDLVAYLEANSAELEQLIGRAEVVDVNSAAVELYGADSKDDLIENLDRIMTEKSLEMWRGMAEWLVEGGTRYCTECEARRFDGGTITLAFEVFVDESRENYSRVFMTGIDITDREEKERRLREKNDLLREVARVVSHDVTSPLGVIRSKARLIQMTGETDHAEDILSASERVRSLVADLHQLAEEGLTVRDTSSVDLRAVAEDAWVTVDSAGVTLTVQGSRRVEADRERLQQLCANLFENAVEHGSTSAGSQSRHGGVKRGSGSAMADGSPNPSATTEERTRVGTTVRVGTLPDGFYVEDDGSGIPSTDRTEVFERGYTTTPDGTGLGLAIVRRVVDAHGWEVNLTESDEGGARFEIRTDR